MEITIPVTTKHTIITNRNAYSLCVVTFYNIVSILSVASQLAPA